MSRMFSRAIPAIFVIAVFLLVWRGGNILTTAVPKPFEALIILTGVLVVFGIILGRLPFPTTQPFKQIYHVYGLLFGALLFFSAVGSFVSIVKFPTWRDFGLDVAADYGRLLFVFFLFFLTAYLVVSYKNVLRSALFALALSPIAMFVAFVPSSQSFFVKEGRLIGAHADPNYLGSFVAVGIIISIALFLYEESRLRWLGLLNLFIIAPIFLWAASRSAMLALGFALFALFAIYVVRRTSRSRFFNVLIVAGVLLTSISAGFSLFPAPSTLFIYERIMAPFVPEEVIREIVDVHTGEGRPAFEFLTRDNLNFDEQYFSRIRGNLFKAGAITFMRTPLGLGPSFYRWSPVGGVGGSHNTLLEVGLTSGWGGLLVFLIIVGSVFSKTRIFFRAEDWMGISLTVSLFCVLINSLFLDMFTLRWLWLIMGMIVGYSLLKNNDETKGVGSSPHA